LRNKEGTNEGTVLTWVEKRGGGGLEKVRKKKLLEGENKQKVNMTRVNIMARRLGKKRGGKQLGGGEKKRPRGDSSSCQTSWNLKQQPNKKKSCEKARDEKGELLTATGATKKKEPREGPGGKNYGKTIGVGKKRWEKGALERIAVRKTWEQQSPTGLGKGTRRKRKNKGEKKGRKVRKKKSALRPRR